MYNPRKGAFALAKIGQKNKAIGLIRNFSCFPKYIVENIILINIVISNINVTVYFIMVSGAVAATAAVINSLSQFIFHPPHPSTAHTFPYQRIQN